MIVGSSSPRWAVTIGACYVDKDTRRLLRRGFTPPLAKTAEGIDLRGRWFAPAQNTLASTASTDKQTDGKHPPVFCRLAHLPVARSDLGLVLCCNKYKRAMTARFHNVAEGNISRLRDAQAFHAAVKRPPYFTFARQRRHFTAGHNLPGFLACPLRGLVLGLIR